MSATLPPITALFPVKGASARVPGKNLRDFHGRPLLCRVLDTLHAAAFVDRIIVNTDSPELAEVAGAYRNVVVHERPAHLCGHDVSMNRILAHDIRLLGPGHYLQTHATNPLLTTATLADAVKTYFALLPQYDSLFSVVRHQKRFFSPDMRPLNHDSAVLLNTQDLPPIFEENSCLYIFSDTSFFAACENRIGKRYQLYPMSSIESLDIDTEEDFRLAETAWKAFREPCGCRSAKRNTEETW
jgi:CMP-N-acetylneuraminic acid synthetase